MIHIILFIICFLSIELFIRLNFSGLLFALLNLMKKVVHIISNKNISDHWKEIIVPKYSIKMMTLSLRILVIFSIIIFLFLITNIFSDEFIKFSLSKQGIFESIIFCSLSILIRKLNKK